MRVLNVRRAEWVEEPGEACTHSRKRTWVCMGTYFSRCEECGMSTGVYDSPAEAQQAPLIMIRHPGL